MDRREHQQARQQAQQANWPSNLRTEHRSKGIGRGAQAGLAVTGSLLVGLLVLSWNGPFTAQQPPTQQGPAPVAVTR